VIRVEDIAADGAFCHLGTLAGVPYDLRYASDNNFAGRNLYGALDCAWLRREAAQGLQAAAAWLAAHRPDWRILVLDALRPQRVQEAIWHSVAGTVAQEYFANPQRGSIHSWGMAVDVTLLDEGGREMDMGSGFDAMTPVSHPALHAQHLASGVLGAHHVAQRECLREAMAQGGFQGIANEWWHFDHGDRDHVRNALPRIY
jgi:D-alanyl-D-alanine dipeptidase